MSEQIQAYLTGVETLKKAVAGLTAEQLKARPVPGKPEVPPDTWLTGSTVVAG